MAYTTINKSSEHFNTKLFTGNGSTNAVTGVGFQPDFVWLKNRNTTANHHLYDAVRGATKQITSVDTRAESTQTNGLTAFGSDGFTVGIDGDINGSGNGIASWNWKANGAGSTNTVGDINSTVSVNTTAGFSIVKWTGNNTAGNTVGHGLGAVPKVVIIKRLDTTGSWISKFNSSTDGYFYLHTADGISSSSGWLPTSSTTFTLANQWTSYNASGSNYIAYCFAEKTGYSKFGQLISNGNDSGSFCYTGFAPKWVMLKPNVTDGWSHWYIFDTARDHPQLNDMPLYANLTTQEGYYGGSPATNYAQIDMLSNGFKIRRDGNWGGGGNGTELIYMAFGQSLVGTNGVTAKAR